MSPNRKRDTNHANRFPRVSGDEPEGKNKQLKNQLFSPRERG